MRRKLQLSGSIASLLTLLMAFQNCGDAGFIASNLSAKTLLLKQSHVLEDSKIPSAEDETDDESSETASDVPASTDTKVPGQVICAVPPTTPSTDPRATPDESKPDSVRLRAGAAAAAKGHATVTVSLVSAGTAAVVCTLSGLDVNLKSLPHKIGLPMVSQALCPGLTPGVYAAIASDSSSMNGATAGPMAMRAGAQVLAARASSGAFELSLEPQKLPTLPIYLSETEVEAGDCDSEGKADPLIIDLNTSSDESLVSLSLTDKINGILFNILGATAGQIKQQVSWMNPQKPSAHYFVALPNSSGRILGIDQLFGDNTTGPDGQLASDGFASLAKYDGRRANGTIDASARDGVIDAKDAVFSQLRFWSDRNGNGVADAGEVKSAKELNIKSIDLRYDPSFREIDKHGNVAKFKSIVQTNDGKLHIIFDLFLQYR